MIILKEFEKKGEGGKKKKNKEKRKNKERKKSDVAKLIGGIIIRNVSRDIEKIKIALHE